MKYKLLDDEQPGAVSAPAAPSKGFRLLDDTNANPTQDSSFLQNAREGLGMGMAKIGRAVGQAVGLVDQSEIDESNRLDQALSDTTGGKIGNVVGQAALMAPTMLIPGANTTLGAGLIGTGVGALTTEGGLAERAAGAGYGAAGGAIGNKLGHLAGDGLAALTTRFSGQNAARQALSAGKDAAATTAAGAGYVIPPADVNPTMLNEVLNGISGKIKTAQSASAKNQGVTNAMVKKDLGIALDEQVSREALNNIRKQAGNAYESVRSVGIVPTDPSYLAKIDALAAVERQAGKDFPKLAKSTISDIVEGLKVKQFDASSGIDQIRTLRDQSGAAYQSGDKQLGKALKSAADALEEQIDRHLDIIQAPGDLIREFRNARQTIAKTYTVEKALNDVTGDVSAPALAGQLKRGKPLSGNMKTAAEVATAYPKAMQALSEAPKSISPLDYFGGVVAGGATGSPLGAAMIAARPAIRAGILSGPYQRQMMTPNYGNSRLMQLMTNSANNQRVQALTPGLAALLAADAGQ